MFTFFRYPNGILRKQICAGDTVAAKDSCQVGLLLLWDCNRSSFFVMLCLVHRGDESHINVIYLCDS